MTHINIPIFVPHLGCPHACVFCDQKKITGSNTTMTKEIAEGIIKDHLKTIDKKTSYVEIAFFGGSFTAIDMNLQTELASIAKKYIDKGLVDSFRCSTRPDCIDEGILLNLKKYGISTIELGVQSMDNTVLALSERGHTKEDVIKASGLIKSHGINLGLQMMTNLPGDTFEKSVRTCEEIIALSPSCVRVYPTLTLPGTKLYDMYTKGEYKPYSLEETVELLSVIIDKFTTANINVIRVGLQTTDNINQSTVIGPYHQAIRELAESRIFRKKLENAIYKNDCKQITVHVNPRYLSKALGQKKCNMVYFKEKYDKIITITPDEDVTVGEFII